MAKVEYMQDDYVCCHRMTPGPCEVCRKGKIAVRLQARINEVEAAIEEICDCHVETGEDLAVEYHQFVQCLFDLQDALAELSYP